ncbi:hypothetical protein N7532_006052 [Penicillium argentinense]|uniref:Zn(2)-C6 fungal-type domain-containing protein n=1 Tax=Penicillium argentinense TaxID=1131581 RepID=A0A9W9FF67_9EURO|nr:uncharacterized protein N7532_006052 [Penicillium argentinense]KAJ5099051.1 hypothetical protein N7532_006052 [Penicillium argentinense]
MDPELRIRKRVPKACRRCHRRKQKCDLKVPTCSNCESANQPCSRAECAPSWHHGMSKGALAHRIEILESRLATALQGSISHPVEVSEDVSVPIRAACHTSQNRNCDGVVRFLTLGSEGCGEQTYLGPSSGLAIADAVGTKLLPVNSNNQYPKPDLAIQEKTDIKAAPPDDTNGAQILDTYFTHMHARLPFLDRGKIIELHAKRYHRPGSTPEDQFDKFKLFMVYAIGAEILQMTEKYDSTPPNDFLLTALQFDPTLRESLSVASIEAMMLLVIYNLRSSSNSSVWYMIGLAMRTCIDFGFHREARYRKLRPYEAEVQRRLFWSVYIIERYTAWSLGRPFSIAEEEIDTQPPFNLDDSITDDTIVERLTRGDPDAEQSKGTMGRFVASVKLQRIVSQIHTRIYRVDKHISTLMPEIAPLMISLNAFKETLPSLDLEDGDFVHMHWNNSIRMLLQPFLSILSPQDKLISTCMASSGKMCQFFKKLRQRDFCGYSFLLVNSVFMAGLTMCFCLFRSPALWTPTVSNDLRACSSALFVMAERNTRLKKHRDGLETIINRAMEHVQEASETAHNNSVVVHNSGSPQNEPPMHMDTSTDFPPALESFMQQTHSGPPFDTSPQVFDPQNGGSFPNLNDFPFDLQDDILGEDGDSANPFHGVFTEEFWAADAFNLPILDGFVWRI